MHVILTNSWWVLLALIAAAVVMGTLQVLACRVRDELAIYDLARAARRLRLEHERQEMLRLQHRR